MDKSDKNKISLIKLGGRLKEAASLAALCMADNEYYLKLYGGLSRERRMALMEERIAKTVGYCAENDGAFGVCAADGRLAAYEYMVDYRRLAEGSPEFYNFIFSSDGDGTTPLPHFEEMKKVLSSLLKEGRSVTYVLGCGVAPAARRDFRVLAAMAHFNRRLLREKDVIAADFSNGELLSLCAGQGNFEIRKLDEDYWFFLRR
ncbi:MAG: hypothetical protein MR000_13095 [Cloacibacillus porcorum]|uniref:hypothetical protein n=1 Tax=Cloacibacillus porcorum TaxID=1197717 RepID=UPI002355EEA7|nr:hypothetical protein [Cloacibacillus porcorum]MCI5866154.1 hypothetical protein [Cloacibacillus porcorum]